MIDTKYLNVLLVDDDDVSLEGVERSLRKIGIDSDIIPAENGAVALDILRGRHPQRHIEKPYVVVLDLNMPRMNGFEFLQELRDDLNLHETVVFVLTTSEREADRARAYQQHIAGYMVKSAAGPQFAKLACLLYGYRAAVTLPA